jgi:hypothetical protein
MTTHPNAADCNCARCVLDRLHASQRVVDGLTSDGAVDPIAVLEAAFAAREAELRAGIVGRNERIAGLHRHHAELLELIRTLEHQLAQALAGRRERDERVWKLCLQACFEWVMKGDRVGLIATCGKERMARDLAVLDEEQS